jgi:hypothetical protein
MAFSGNFMCTSFKVELMKAVHNFTTGTGDTFKLALYDNSASFTPQRPRTLPPTRSLHPVRTLLAAVR